MTLLTLLAECAPVGILVAMTADAATWLCALLGDRIDMARLTLETAMRTLESVLGLGVVIEEP